MPVEKTEKYIRIRVADPKQFIRFRVKPLGKGIRAIIGFMKKGGSKIQSLLFSRKTWTLAKAKAWVKKHNYTVQESYIVTDVDIDPESLELVLEETVAEDVEAEEDSTINVEKMSKDDFAWLIE